MRTVFFGTPAIAVPALRALAETTELVAVVCQPDRPAGRGLQLQQPAVKLAAIELGIPVEQPVKVKTGNLAEWLKALDPDVALVLAYGRILPQAVLAAPRRGCLNLHASLLPRYRGAAPIQWALICGETETGISFMQMDEGLDTGPVLCKRAIPIAPDDDSSTLSAKLAELAARMVREDLPRIAGGELLPEPQNDDEATLAPPLSRDHGLIDWREPRDRIVNLVRGLSPRPGATTTRSGRVLKILAARVGAASPADPGRPAPAATGTVVRADRGGLWVSAGDGVVELVRAQVEGKKAMGGADLVNGRAIALGDRLGEGAAGT